MGKKDKNKNVIVSPSFVEKLEYYLKSKSHIMKYYALSSIENGISPSNNNLATMIENTEIISSIVSLLTSINDILREQAARTAALICITESGRKEFFDAGGSKILCQTLEDLPSISIAAAGAICNLIHNQSYKQQLVNEALIHALLKLFAKVTDKERETIVMTLVAIAHSSTFSSFSSFVLSSYLFLSFLLVIR